jgi:hypothetical protein
MIKYVKQIQSNLKYKGVKVSQTDIKPIYTQLVSDIDNPTKEELDSVMQHFLATTTAIQVSSQESAKAEDSSELAGQENAIVTEDNSELAGQENAIVTEDNSELAGQENAIVTEDNSELAGQESSNQQENNLPVKADSHQLDSYQRNQSIIISTINTAPTEIRDNLLQRYAQQQFNQVADLLAFKQTIDDEINSYFTRKLAEQNAANTQKWRAIEEEFKVESDREVTRRLESFRSFLEDFRSKLV